MLGSILRVPEGMGHVLKTTIGFVRIILDFVHSAPAGALSDAQMDER